MGHHSYNSEVDWGAHVVEIISIDNTVVEFFVTNVGLKDDFSKLIGMFIILV